MEDSALVDLYWQRSERAIDETEQKYGRYCRSIAFSICGSRQDAEECVNDTWLAAWNAMPDKRPARLSGFLGCLTRHFAINRYRAETSQKRGGAETALALEELSECIPSRQDPQRQVELRELEQAVGRFVSGLGEAERQVFIARYWYLHPVSEIARKLHYSESKTKSILFRQRNKLRKQLMEEGLC